SRSIAFFAGGKLKRILLSGGAPSVICDSALGRGGTWSSHGVIVFAAQGASLHRVPENGGESQEITHLRSPISVENKQLWPHFLPDGRQFLYFAYGLDPENSASTCPPSTRPRAAKGASVSSARPLTRSTRRLAPEPAAMWSSRGMES